MNSVANNKFFDYPRLIENRLLAIRETFDYSRIRIRFVQLRIFLIIQFSLDLISNVNRGNTTTGW